MNRVHGAAASQKAFLAILRDQLGGYQCACSDIAQRHEQIALQHQSPVFRESLANEVCVALNLARHQHALCLVRDFCVFRGQLARIAPIALQGLA